MHGKVCKKGTYYCKCLFILRIGDNLYIEYLFREEELNDIDKDVLKGIRKEFERVLKKLNNCEYRHFKILFHGDYFEDREIKILDLRYEKKLRWDEVSKRSGLSKRHCQRIKDQVLDIMIRYALNNKEQVTCDIDFLNYFDITDMNIRR